MNVGEIVGRVKEHSKCLYTRSSEHLSPDRMNRAEPSLREYTMISFAIDDSLCCAERGAREHGLRQNGDAVEVSLDSICARISLFAEHKLVYISIACVNITIHKLRCSRDSNMRPFFTGVASCLTTD